MNISTKIDNTKLDFLSEYIIKDVKAYKEFNMSDFDRYIAMNKHAVLSYYETMNDGIYFVDCEKKEEYLNGEKSDKGRFEVSVKIRVSSKDIYAVVDIYYRGAFDLGPNPKAFISVIETKTLPFSAASYFELATMILEMLNSLSPGNNFGEVFKGLIPERKMIHES